MTLKFIKVTPLLFALSCAALPGAAYAGTSTASGAAALRVVSQCMVAGSNADLGTYLTTDIWNTVATELGRLDSLSSYVVGTKGQEYLNYGSVTCAAGTPFSLNISGTAPQDLFTTKAIMLQVNGKVMMLQIAVKKVGSVTISDTSSFAGLGQLMTNGRVVPATGTGSPQFLLGSAVVASPSPASTASLFEKLTTAGVYTDSLTYTLNF